MKSNPLFTLLCLFAMLCFSDCKRCEPENKYTDNTGDVIPYVQGSVFGMRNDSAVAIQFTDNSFLDSYSGGASCECCDGNYGQVVTTTLQSDSITITLQETASADGSDYFSVTVGSVKFYARVTSGSLRADSRTQFHSVSSITIGSRTYTDVTLLTNGQFPVPASNAISIWYHPTQGLLKIQFNDGRVWELA